MARCCASQQYHGSGFESEIIVASAIRSTRYALFSLLSKFHVTVRSILEHLMETACAHFPTSSNIIHPDISQQLPNCRKHRQSATKSSSMEYLELDDAATQAFEELGGDFDLPHIPSKPFGSTNTSTTSAPKRPRRRVKAS